MADDDIAFFVVAPYLGHWEISTYPPTSSIMRVNCGHLGWISERGPAFAERTGAYTFCQVCAEANYDPEPEQKYAIPGAMDELRQMYSEADMAVIEAKMREAGITEL